MIKFLDPKANLRSLVVVFLVLLIVIPSWWILSKVTGVPGPKTILKGTPITIKKTILVPSGKLISYTITPPSSKIPGWLYGSFSVSGARAGIKGATDDTLVGFHILDPKNNILNRLDHPATGSFSLRVETPGTYTFVFDNAGIIRMSDRKVTFDMEYLPD